VYYNLILLKIQLTMNRSKKIKLLLSISILFVGNIVAQNSKVEVIQDYKLKKITEYRSDTKTFDIYRIQIFTGNRTNAYDAKKMFKEKYPEIESEIHYESPNYKIWAGTYRSRLEVDKALMEIKKEYPYAFITKPNFSFE
jgi:hypothetical protein